jgi:hypothetical protein
MLSATHATVLFTVACLCGCTPPNPAPRPAIGPTKVAAPFSKTWNAVVDILAERNIPVKTLDRASGFVAAEMTGVAPGDIGKLASGCGGFWDAMANGGGAPAGVARYNILVRGDSIASTVKVTAQFTELISGTTKQCATKGVFEAPFQEDVKARAEPQ